MLALRQVIFVSYSLKYQAKSLSRVRHFTTLKTDPNASNKTIPVTNPANGDLVKILKCDNDNSINEKFQNASKFQKEWQRVPVAEKKQYLTKFGGLLMENIEDLAKTLSTEVGKPLQQSRNEIKGTNARIKYFVDNVEEVTKTRVEKKTNDLIEEVRYEPLGVIANISAWNYPHFVGVNVYAPALLTGNVVLYKPSEYASVTGLYITELLRKAGIPENAFIPIIGKGQVGEYLIQQNVNGVFFTGSNSTGEKIAKSMAGRMVRMQLELGGKDPMYVCEDSDPEFAAKSLADGAMYNTGQSCCSVERIYVHSKVYKQFLDVFVNEVKGFKVGDPINDKDAYIGPLTMPTQPDFLLKQVEDAKNKGARVLIGGNKGKLTQHGNWFEPTVLVNVNHSMDVMKEESFGPIIGIQEVGSNEEAISLMNDTKYGLTAGIYTKNQKVAEDILPQINSGSVYWNACDRVSPSLPWSGRKGSGIGSTLGRDGILSFVQPKAYHLIKK